MSSMIGDECQTWEGKKIPVMRWRSTSHQCRYCWDIIREWKVVKKLGAVTLFYHPLPKSHLFHHFKYWITLTVDKPSARSNNFRNRVPKQLPVDNCWQLWHLGAQSFKIEIHPHWYRFVDIQSTVRSLYLWWRSNSRWGHLSWNLAQLCHCISKSK